MPELIPVGTAAENSADIVVEAGTPVSIWLKTANGGNIPSYVSAYVEIKDAAGNYTPVGLLNSQEPGAVLWVAGTYRVRKSAYGVAVGVEQA